MKKINLIILLSFFCCSILIGQDRNRFLIDIYEYDKQLNELVTRVTDSLGGQKRNLDIKSFQSNGEVTSQTGDKALFEFFYMKDDWIRLDQKKEGEYVFFSRHGKRGWKKILAKNEAKEEQLRGIELSEEHQFSFYENNLFDYEKEGLEIYFEGELAMGNTEAYIIRLAGFRYWEELYYISKTSYRPFMKQVYFLDRNNQSVINYTIEEYLEIEGVWLPKKVGLEMDGTTKLFEFFDYDLTAKFDKDFFVN